MKSLFMRCLRPIGSKAMALGLAMGLLVATTVHAQTAAPSLRASSTATCGSPISVTASCQPNQTVAFIGSGGSSSGNVYTYTLQGSYTLTATCSGGAGTSTQATPVRVAINALPSAPTLTPSTATVIQGAPPVVITASGCTGGYVTLFGPDGPIRANSVTIPTTEIGYYEVSALCTRNNCRSDLSVAKINVVGTVASLPLPSVVNPIPSQTGVVGTTFNYLIPAGTFRDPNGDPLTLTAAGLPTGFFFNGLVLTGPLTAVGTTEITITASNARGVSVSTRFFITALPGQPQVGGALQLLTPAYDPCSRVIIFNTSGGDGTPITYSAIGVQRNGPTSNVGTVDYEVVVDNKTLIIQAVQSGVTSTISFTPQSCSSTPPNPGTGTGGTLQLLTPSYDPCTRQIIFNTAGGDGTPITFVAVGVERSSPQSTTGTVEAGVVLDNKTLNILAMQSGKMVNVVFTPTPCVTVPPSTTTAPPSNTTTPPPTNGPLVMLQPTYDPCTRQLTINTSGGDGTPIIYTAVGVMRTSPMSNTGVVELGVVLDNKTLNLLATQSGQTVTTSFAPARCTATGQNRTTNEGQRNGTESPENSLRMTVLGNPAEGTEVAIDVTGAYNQKLQVRLIDTKGQLVSEQVISSAKAVEQVVLPFRSSARGVFIIQAVSDTNATVTKVIH